MMWLAFGITAALAIAAVALMLRQAARTAKIMTTAPTPAEAKIEVDGQAALEQADTKAATERQEVQNASGESLRLLGIRRLFRTK